MPPQTSPGYLDPSAANIMALSQQNQQQPQPQQQQPQESFLQSALPTIGGILGGIGGGLIDVGTLGAATPFINPLTLGIGGAALGSAAGKGLEHITEGQNPLQGDVATAGLEGGLGQAAGGVVGGILGKIGSKLLNYGTERAGQELLSNEFGSLGTQTARDLNLSNSVDLAKRMGIPMTARGFQDAATLGTGVTNGESGVLNNFLDKAVIQAHPQGVDLSDYGSAAANAIRRRSILGGLEPTTGGGGGLPKTTGQGGLLMSNLRGKLQDIGYGGVGSLDNVATPQNALKLMRELRAAGNTKGLTQAERGVYDDMVSYLKGKVYNGDVDKLVSNFRVSPEDESFIRMVSRANSGDESFGNALIDHLNASTKASDITDLERQLIDMREAGSLAESTNAARNIVGAPEPNAVIDAAGNLVSGNKAAILGKLFQKAQGGVSGLATKAGSLLERMSPFTGDDSKVLSKVLPAAGVTIGTSPNVADAAANNSAALQGGAMSPTGLPTTPMGGSGAPQSPLATAYNMALIGMSNPYTMGQTESLLQSILPNIQKIQGAEAALPATERAYVAAGGGQGLIPGLLARLGGILTGGPAATYSNQSDQLAQQLNALGIPSSYIPQITQSNQSGQLGFQELQQLIQAMGGSGVLGTVPAQ